MKSRWRANTPSKQLQQQFMRLMTPSSCMFSVHYASFQGFISHELMPALQSSSNEEACLNAFLAKLGTATGLQFIQQHSEANKILNKFFSSYPLYHMQLPPSLQMVFTLNSTQSAFIQKLAQTITQCLHSDDALSNLKLVETLELASKLLTLISDSTLRDSLLDHILLQFTNSSWQVRSSLINVVHHLSEIHEVYVEEAQRVVAAFLKSTLSKDRTITKAMWYGSFLKYIHHFTEEQKNSAVILGDDNNKNDQLLDASDTASSTVISEDFFGWDCDADIEPAVKYYIPNAYKTHALEHYVQRIKEENEAILEQESIYYKFGQLLPLLSDAERLSVEEVLLLALKKASPTHCKDVCQTFMNLNEVPEDKQSPTLRHFIQEGLIPLLLQKFEQGEDALKCAIVWTLKSLIEFMSTHDENAVRLLDIFAKMSKNNGELGYAGESALYQCGIWFQNHPIPPLLQSFFKKNILPSLLYQLFHKDKNNQYKAWKVLRSFSAFVCADKKAIVQIKIYVLSHVSVQFDREYCEMLGSILIHLQGHEDLKQAIASAMLDILTTHTLDQKMLLTVSQVLKNIPTVDVQDKVLHTIKILMAHITSHKELRPDICTVFENMMHLIPLEACVDVADALLAQLYESDGLLRSGTCKALERLIHIATDPHLLTHLYTQISTLARKQDRVVGVTSILLGHIASQWPFACDKWQDILALLFENMHHTEAKVRTDAHKGLRYLSKRLPYWAQITLLDICQQELTRTLDERGVSQLIMGISIEVLCSIKLQEAKVFLNLRLPADIVRIIDHYAQPRR